MPSCVQVVFCFWVAGMTYFSLLTKGFKLKEHESASKLLLPMQMCLSNQGVLELLHQSMQDQHSKRNCDLQQGTCSQMINNKSFELLLGSQCLL